MNGRLWIAGIGVISLSIFGWLLMAPTRSESVPAPFRPVKSFRAQGEFQQSGLQRLAADPNLLPTAEIDDYRVWAQTDPGACLAWILENLQGVSKTRAMEEAIGVWSRQDPPAALGWLLAVEPSHAVEPAISVAFAEMAGVDGPEAAAWLERNPSHASLDLHLILLDRWAEHDEAAAAAWALRPLDPRLRASLLPSMLAALPSFSAELLADTPADGRDPALRTAIASLPEDNHDFALSLALQIGNAILRESEMNRIGNELGQASLIHPFNGAGSED